MEITGFVESLRQDLAAAAAAGGEETRDAAERLLLALEPAVRLTLMEALAQAAAEITSELPSGSVEVRLRGREPELVVNLPVPEPAPPAPAEIAEEADDGAIIRLTLRLPEQVKQRAEELAGRSGQSLNSWLVSALRRATSGHAVDVDLDLSSIPTFDPPGRRGPRRMSGWV